MGKLNEIRNKLKSGTTPRQLIEQGYSKSSIYHENKKLRNSQPDVDPKPVPNELQELRYQMDILKLQNKITDLESTKEKLQDRVAAIEKTMPDLRSMIENSVDTALRYALECCGADHDEAHKVANSFVEELIKQCHPHIYSNNLLR